MRKLLLFIVALLWGLPAWGQTLPPGTTGLACLATSAAPTLTDNRYGAVTCDLGGALRILAASLPLPSGAATAANQTTEIAAIQNRWVAYSEAANVALAANGFTTTTTRVPTSSYTKFNATAGCDAAGAVLVVRGSNDNYVSSVVIANVAIPVGSRNSATGVAGASASVPLTFTTAQAYIQNGANANTCSLVSSFTAN